MYAIIETGGKQYMVSEGDVIKVEKLDANEGEVVELNNILAVSKDEQLHVGNPYLENAKVTATVIKQGRDKKIIVFKYKNKTNYRKKQGHRQYFTEIKIDNIDF
jgi:large subunit ribosomal protein L21